MLMLALCLAWFYYLSWSERCGAASRLSSLRSSHDVLLVLRRLADHLGTETQVRSSSAKANANANVICSERKTTATGRDFLHQGLNV